MSQSGKYGLGVTPPISVPDGGTGLTTITDHALMVGSGTSAITVLAAATDGQIPIGSTGADPVLANITSSGGTVTITNGAGTINLEIGGALATSYSTDSGSAVPALGVLTVAGGTNINTAGAGSTVTVNLDAAVSGLTSLDLAAGGRFGTSTGAGETALIQAYDTGGASYTTFATLTANATPTMDLDDAVTKAGQYIYRAAGTDVPVTDGGTGASSLTDHGIMLGSGTGAITVLAEASDGQIPIGSTGNDPVLATVTGGNNIGITNAAGSITVNVNGTTQYALQVGDATNSLDSLAIGTANQVLQSGGAGANPAWSTATYPATTSQGDVLYSSSDNTLASLAKDATATRYLANTGASNNPAWDQVNLANGITGTLPVGNGGSGAATFTDHGVLVGSGASAFTALTVGTDGQVLVGSSAADPVFATLASSDGSITYATGAGTLGLTVTQATTGQLGGSTLATTAEVTTGTDTQKIVTCAGVAAKLGTQTDHGVLVGSGSTNAVTALAVGATNEVLLGSTGADPTWGAVDLTTAVTGTLPVANGGTGVSSNTAYAVLCGGTTTTNPVQSIASVGTSGQVLTSNGAGALPTFQAAASGGISWNEVTGTSQSMSVNNGYITNNVALVTCTLPDTAALGSIVRIAGKGAGGWKIAQNAGETIYWDESTATTTGATGYLQSTDDYDAIELVCITADTDWVVISSKGNVTVA